MNSEQHACIPLALFMYITSPPSFLDRWDTSSKTRGTEASHIIALAYFDGRHLYGTTTYYTTTIGLVVTTFESKIGVSKQIKGDP